MEKNEIYDLFLSMIVISLVFALVLSGGVFELVKNLYSLPFSLLLSFLTVSLAFFVHELSHRAVAMKLRYYAIYKKWDFGLKFSLLFSVFGFAFIMPGAVHIYPRMDLWGSVRNPTRKENALISLAGPLSNIILAAFFFIISKLLTLIFPFSLILTYAININSWLAFFNLIPFGPLDGVKIFVWRKDVWIVLLILSLVFMLLL